MEKGKLSKNKLKAALPSIWGDKTDKVPRWLLNVELYLLMLLIEQD